MIAGTGIDIVDIKRIEKLIERYDNQFLSKVFTEAEIALCGAKAVPAIHFSGRWAAKEAFYKALPVELQQISNWKSVQILPAEDERHPAVDVLNMKLNELLKENNINIIHVSISHEQTYCVAMVILERP